MKNFALLTVEHPSVVAETLDGQVRFLLFIIDRVAYSGRVQPSNNDKWIIVSV